MPKSVVKCEVDGIEIGQYEFNCNSVSKPQKLDGGPITAYFDPANDVHYQMEINNLSPSRSSTNKAGDSKIASSGRSGVSLHLTEPSLLSRILVEVSHDSNG